ncbi:MAG: gliding motility-associated C-terminal domain-containing protein [Bacteroidales bacterium]|nr:gliding motility-associated C-terminal domain-containing protein [Bacteroidales bacterium]
MKKIFAIITTILVLCANLGNAQVNGFTLNDASFPAPHALGDIFPINVSFNWPPTTTSAVIVLDYDPSMVSYNSSCASSLPACIAIANNGTQLTIALSSLSACTNTNAISFNVCFQFNCPDTCTGVTKTALFSGLITDDIPSTQTDSCTANGILNNSVTLNHNFHSYNVMTNEITFRACFNNPNCFTINDPTFEVVLAPALGIITSVIGTNYSYTLAGNIISPNVAAFTRYANDCFYYVVKLECDTGLGQTLTSNLTLKAVNCGIPNSIITGPVAASFTIPAVPVATSTVAVNAYSTSNNFTYSITNTGNNPISLTATNFVPLVHLKNSPSNSVTQTTSQPGLVGSIIYVDCFSSPTATNTLIGNNASDGNAPANTTKFIHAVNNLLPGQWVMLNLFYDLTSSCNGPAGDPPYQDSVSIHFICEPGGGPVGGCVPCGEGDTINIVTIYNPFPNIACVTSQYIEGCKNVGDTLDLCYEFRNGGDADFIGGTYNVPLPAWLLADHSTVTYTGFSTDPTIVPSSNLEFNLPDIPFGTNTYKICFQAVIHDGAVGGANTIWPVVSGGNLINPQNVCQTNFNICAFAAIGIDKKVKGSLDTNFGTSGYGNPNSTVTYQITIRNTGTVAVDSLVVIDRIPAIGNLSILGSPNSVAINNQFNMQMQAAPTDVNYLAEYTTTQNICTGWPATGTNCNLGSWGSSLEDGGVSFTFTPSFTLQPGDDYTFTFNTTIPDGTANGMVDCNTAGFIAKSLSGGYNINPVETNPVCVTVIIDSCHFLCNSDFEDNQLVQVGEQGFFSQDSVPCWNTTTEDKIIEVWGDGFNGVPSYSGNQFIELNAHVVGTLYQNFTATPGNTVNISFAHRGRVGFTNSMSVSLEPAPLGSGIPVNLGTFNAVTTSWTLNSVSYTFPNNSVTNYVLSFISLPVGGTEAGGNFLDAVSVDCPSSICGVKFNDVNGNGIRETGEPGLPNWTFNLSGTLTLSTTTDSAGQFCFNDLPTGIYTVSEVNQPNWQQTSPLNPDGYTISLFSGFAIDTLVFGNTYSDPDTCSKTDARITPSNEGDCCFLVEISNTYLPDFFTGISITSDNLTITSVSNGNNWGTINYQSPTQVDFTNETISGGIPLDDMTGFQTLGTICFAGTGSNQLTVNFLTGNPPETEVLCAKILFNEGCSVPVDTSCVSVVDMKAFCEDGNPSMSFSLHNNSYFTMRGLTLYSQNPDITPNQQFIPIPDLLPGQTSATIVSLLTVLNNATNGCFFISACDQNTAPGTNGEFPQYCCMDSILYCVQIPSCDPCSNMTVTATPSVPDKCCYNLTLTSNYILANIKYIEFTGIGGTQFALLSGWSITPPVSSSHVKIIAPGSGITPGTYPDFASFCLTGISSLPHRVLVKMLGEDGQYLCTDTLEFDCDLVEPTCATIVNDSLYCVGDNIKYTFYVKNNAPFPLYQIDFRTPDSAIILDSNYVEPNPPITLGATGGPYTVTVYSTNPDLNQFCMYLTGHNGIYNPELGLAATECCTDSLSVVCLPMVKCESCDTTGCCQFENMTIPNGITPNGDGFNDVYEILNSSCCDFISIEVYNRWGNQVYQNKDYKNDWKGENQSGTALVQGTYFIVLELPNGNKKATYLDIRY